MVISVACGKVVKASDVAAEPLPESMASGTAIKWLIGEKDQPPTFYMRLFEMAPQGHIRAHFHPWEHEIFVLSGSGEVRIGLQKHKVEAGTAIYIPPNVEHEYWAGEEGMTFLCIIPKSETAPRLEKPIECG
jgi:quercetin dioxygenase-like cupin family protein